MSLYFLMLVNFDIIRRDRHFVFLFQFLLFTHSPAQCSWTQAPSFARIFLEVLPITMILFPSELAALGYVHFIPPLPEPSSFSGSSPSQAIVVRALKSCPTLWLHGLQHARLPCPSLSQLVTTVGNSFCLFIPLLTDNFIKLSLCCVVEIKINEMKFSFLNQTMAKKN